MNCEITEKSTITLAMYNY